MDSPWVIPVSWAVSWIHSRILLGMRVMIVALYPQPISLRRKQYFQFWVLYSKKDKGERNQDAEALQAMSHAEWKAEKENSEEHISCLKITGKRSHSGELKFFHMVLQGGAMTSVVELGLEFYWDRPWDRKKAFWVIWIGRRYTGFEPAPQNVVCRTTAWTSGEAH